MKAIPSTYHQTVNYLTNIRQVNLLSSQLAAQQCYQLSVWEHIGEKSSDSPPIEDQTPAYQSQFVAQIKAEDKDMLAMDPLEKVTLDGPKKFTYVNSLLSNEKMEHLQLILLNNIYVSIWSHSNMVRINPTVASYKLNIIPATRLVK